MGGKAPEPPDFESAAERTAESDRQMLAQQTRSNRIEQNTPWGQVSFDSEKVWDDASGQYLTDWTQNTTLNGDSQRALDAQLGITAERSELGESMLGRAKSEFGEEMDWSQLSDRGGVPQGGMDARQQAEDALYGRATSRLDPQWEQRTGDKEAKLAAQGLRPGDVAYDREMENLGRERTDAYQQAQYGATVGGGSEATNQQNRELTQSNYQNQLRNAELAETMQRRGFSLNEINALVSGQQVSMPSMPGFSTAGRAAGTDYSGAAQAQNTADLNAFSADQAAMQGMMQGASSMAMMCDRRLKTNIKRVGSFRGYSLYSFDYIWGVSAVGVMADEVNPEAVITMPSGYKAVDYMRIK